MINAVVKFAGKPRFMKKPPSLIMAVGARESTLVDAIGSHTNNSKLKKFAFGQILKALKKKDPKAWRSRVF